MAAVVALGFLVPACGYDATGPPVVFPPPRAAVVAQKALAPASAVDQLTGIAGDAVVQSGSPGPSPRNVEAATAPISIPFAFASSLNLNVDLDALDDQGQDRFPGIEGMLSVTAVGSVQGASGAGSALYQTTVIAMSDVYLSDPLSNEVVSLRTGSQWSFSLQVDWSVTDTANWMLLARSEVSFSGLEMLLDQQGEAILVRVDGHLGVTTSISSSAGVDSRNRAVESQFLVLFTDLSGSHEVWINRTSIDVIVITVDGQKYGPFTRALIRAFLQVNVV